MASCIEAPPELRVCAFTYVFVTSFAWMSQHTPSACLEQYDIWNEESNRAGARTPQDPEQRCTQLACDGHEQCHAEPFRGAAEHSCVRRR
jgi:hypothetical protein